MTDNTNGVVQDEHEYVCVGVTRTEYAELYVRVPKGLRPSNKHRVILGLIAKYSTKSSDWEDRDWEKTLSVQGCRKVAPDEAEPYTPIDWDVWEKMV